MPIMLTRWRYALSFFLGITLTQVIRAEDTATAIRPVTTPAAAGQEIEFHVRRQEVGKLSVAWDNVGKTAGQFNGFIPDDCEPVFDHGVEYPKGTNHRSSGFHLWLGGIKDRDTVVSAVEDVFFGAGIEGGTFEMWPAPPPEGDLVERTNRERLRRGVLCSDLTFSQHAISEHDLISIATDTVTDVNYTGVNPFDQRKHHPLGLKITCRRYAWSYDYADDFVLVDYKLEHLGPSEGTPGSRQRIEGLYIGVVVRGGVTEIVDPNYHYRDGTSIMGHLDHAPLQGRPAFQEPLNLVWVADEDGNPVNGAFDALSVTEVFGLRVLKPGPSESKFSFNWWTDDGRVNGWGPRLLESNVDFVSQGNFGRPETDRGKYQIMTNGEMDYPQVDAAIAHAGWQLPPANGSLIASSAAGYVDGLLSFGPYQLEPGDSMNFTLAMVAGERFHSNPYHFSGTFDPFHPEAYMAGLDFSDLIQNSRWAGWLYDAPGFDSDGDGDKGEFFVDGLDTLYYRGDGVPDFKGPPPPPAPPVVGTHGPG